MRAGARGRQMLAAGRAACPFLLAHTMSTGVASLEGAELLSACPDLTPGARGLGEGMCVCWGGGGGFSCKREMIEMPRCQDGAPAPCHRSAMRRRGELSGSFPGRCGACIGLPILALLLRDRSNIPGPGHLRLRWLFFKAQGTHPSEGPAIPSSCSPASSDVSAWVSPLCRGRLGAARKARSWEIRRQPGRAGESRRLRRFYLALVRGHPSLG